MASSVTVSRQACGKIFLHAAKYFESQLIGYLIGSEVNGQLTVSDVLSVCHTNPAGPILELAGDVVSTYLGLFYIFDCITENSSFFLKGGHHVRSVKSDCRNLLRQRQCE